MRLKGYTKASKLSKKLRGALPQPDYIYEFAANRNAAMFWSESRIQAYQSTNEDDFCGTIKLMKADDVCRRFHVSAPQLKGLCKSAIVVIDNTEQGRKDSIVYDSNKLQRLFESVPELIKVKQLQDVEAARQAALKRLELQSCLEKQEAQDALRLRYNQVLVKLNGLFDLLPIENMHGGDIRCRPVINEMRSVCKFLGHLETGKGKYKLRFKTFDLLELFAEEIVAYLKTEGSEAA